MSELTISDLMEIHVSVPKGTAGDSISADANRSDWAGCLEDFKELSFSYGEVKISHIQRSRLIQSGGCHFIDFFGLDVYVFGVIYFFLFFCFFIFFCYFESLRALVCELEGCHRQVQRDTVCTQPKRNTNKVQKQQLHQTPKSPDRTRHRRYTRMAPITRLSPSSCLTLLLIEHLLG